MRILTYTVKVGIADKDDTDDACAMRDKSDLDDLLMHILMHIHNGEQISVSLRRRRHVDITDPLDDDSATKWRKWENRVQKEFKR